MRMKKTMKAIAACAVTAALMCSFTGCGGAKNESGNSGEGAIVVIVKSQQSPDYWNVVNKGAVDGGEEVGYKIVLEAPESESDIDVQNEMVMNAIKDKAAAVVLAPTNTEDLNGSIQAVMDAGIPVVTIDARCSLSDITYIGTDNRAAGGLAGKEASALLSGSKKVAVIALAEGSAVSDERSGGFVDAVSGTGEIVETTYCGADRAVAKTQALELLDKYSDLEMIYAVNQTSTLGVCDAIAEKGLGDKVTVIGFDSSDEEIEFLSSGVLDGFVIQNPYNMGYLGVRNAVKIIDGEVVAKTIDTGTTFVSNTNINDADVQLLLNPLG